MPAPAARRRTNNIPRAHAHASNFAVHGIEGRFQGLGINGFYRRNTEDKLRLMQALPRFVLGLPPVQNWMAVHESLRATRHIALPFWKNLPTIRLPYVQ